MGNLDITLRIKPVLYGAENVLLIESLKLVRRIELFWSMKQEESALFVGTTSATGLFTFTT
jgi:hypothetical protein